MWIFGGKRGCLEGFESTGAGDLAKFVELLNCQTVQPKMHKSWEVRTHFCHVPDFVETFRSLIASLSGLKFRS